MSKCWITLIALGALALSYAFEGTYDVKGYDPYEKKSYEGSVVIKKDKSGTYQALWQLEEGGKEYQDIGTGLKFDEDKISFIFKDNLGGPDEGIQLYTRKEEKTLEGPFTLLNKSLIGKETLTKR